MTTEERIDKSLNDFEFLENQHREDELIKEFDLMQLSKTVLGGFKNLADKSKKNDSNALNFKNGINILIKLLNAYSGLLNKSRNYERKALYYKMKYDSVIDQEEVNRNIIKHASDVMEERDRLNIRGIKLTAEYESLKDENEKLKNKLGS